MLLPALLLAGCGGKATSPGPQADPLVSPSTAPSEGGPAALDVCALLTVDEAARVAKNAVQPGSQQEGLTGAITCNFNLEGGNTPSVTVAVKQGRDYFDFLAGQGEKQAVDGVGQEAFTCEACGGHNLVVLTTKGASVLVRVTRPSATAPPTLDDLKVLAALVVSRL